MVAEIARRQRGVVTRAQLRAASLSESAIKHRVATGSLHRLHRGVYAVGHVALPKWGRETAALLACGEGAALSHMSAAAVWGLARAPITIDVTIPRRKRLEREGLRIHRPLSLTAQETRVRDGLRVTSPKRTLIDLAKTLATTDLERVVAEAHAARLLPAFDSNEMPGTLRAVLDGGPTLTRSEAERILLRLVRRAGLPPPETNVRVAGLEVDALWREQGVAVEVDSWSFHGHRAAFERDRRKDAALRAAGLVPVRVTARQLVHEPELVVAHLAQLLATRGWSSAVRG